MSIDYSINTRKFGRNDPCWCGSGRKYKQCHCGFDQRLESLQMQRHIVPSRTMIKTPEQVRMIKESAKVNIAVLDYVAGHIREGVTTEEIDRWVSEQTAKYHAIPAPLNYEGYPKSVCTSINNIVCHGIPSPDVVLKDGDIVNIDASTILNGYFSDSSRMFCIGQVSEEKKRLVDDMGQAINDFVRANGYSVVRDIGGHGVGVEFHEDPWVSYVSRRGEEMVMAPGLMFTIEPMVNMGKEDIYIDDSDGWTVYTEDGLPSAQWEIQVLVTEDGYEIISY